MVFTVTFNPSLDYMMWVENLNPGRVNRSSMERVVPGGKGINVSLMLSNLEVDSTVLGFIGGFTGEEIEKRINSLGCTTDFIRIADSISRINVKLYSDMETEINAQGSQPLEIHRKELDRKIDRLRSGDILVLAGSIPSSLPAEIYEQIIRTTMGKGIKVVVDASGGLLRNVLKYEPFLIKPNHFELGELFGVKVTSKREAAELAKQLRSLGAENVLVSMAGDGAVLAASNSKIYYADAPKGVALNSVGSGDAMVAGFLAGYLDSLDIDRAFAYGVAAGSASAFQLGFPTKEDVVRCLPEVTITMGKE